MTQFVQIDYSTTHPGVERLETAISAAKQVRAGFSGTRGLAKLLLSAVAAAVMVVAYQVMDTVAEGQLLVIWTGLWAAAFAALALCAGTARRVALRVKSSLDDWSRAVAEAKADERLWKIARTDARVMADLQAAASRADTSSGESALAVADAKDSRRLSRKQARSFSMSRARELDYLI